MSSNEISKRTENVVDGFRKPINDLYLSVYNKVYNELTKESIVSFNDGWTEAVAYMKSHPDCSMEELFEAKKQITKERYPHFHMINLKTTKDATC